MLVNVPIGPWSNDRISNISFNHWGLDTTAAVTWLADIEAAESNVRFPPPFGRQCEGAPLAEDAHKKA